MVSLRSFLEIIFSLYSIHQTVGNIVINVMDGSAYNWYDLDHFNVVIKVNFDY